MGEIFAGRYELIDPIGRGGVGAVWRAWDHRRRRYVAAKVLQQSDAHTLLRFVREQALRIDHPHVLAPMSWAADDDKVLFTMDLVNGGSLAHLSGDYGPLPPRFVCTLLDQLLAGLTAVHAEGVVHRDIKPANLLLKATGTGRPHLRLSDFGIAMRKGEPRLTEANYVVGTPGYFAPEQMFGAEPDFPADLFAVGLVAIYLLTGVKPDPDALIGHFEHGVPDAPEGVPEPLWQVLASLVHPNPDCRFKTATGARKAVLSAVELLPEATIEEEVVEVFDHIGPLPAGYGPDGPLAAGEPGGRLTAEGSGGQPRAGAADGPASSGGEVGSGASGSTGATGTTGAAGSTGAAGHGSASLWGSGGFPLAPPEPSTPPTPASPPLPSPAPSPAHPPMPAQAPSPSPSAPPPPAYEPTAGGRPQNPATRPYTAGPYPVPGQRSPQDSPATPAAAPPAPHRRPGSRRPGPPAKVAVPVLIVALLCIAVGVWALLSA
ncbi:serine/threonine-protein kinase [Streptomyces sp. NPDC001339]|uniref:serine/threonine-protein kinase n=1 Tax=Streptomyces sp. NPDC001339 TaxID=3364563 RepID=UPI0036823D54